MSNKQIEPLLYIHIRGHKKNETLERSHQIKIEPPTLTKAMKLLVIKWIEENFSSIKYAEFKTNSKTIEKIGELTIIHHSNKTSTLLYEKPQELQVING